MKNCLQIWVLACLMMAQTVFAQNIDLTFTGADAAEKYVQLDSVRVENISRSWAETIVYPDTILTLTDETGVSEVEENISSCISYPNPFNGTSRIVLTLPQDEQLSLRVYNLAGQLVMEKHLSVEAGESHFEVSLNHPQVYFLVAQTTHGRLVQKLINTGHSGTNGIVYRGTNSGTISVKTQKLLSSKSFQRGDVLKMTAYATLYNTLVVSETIQQSQTESERLTMVFALPVFSVSATTQVVFSPGNLQWSATNGGNTATTHAVADSSTAAGTWRFAPNQWDAIGAGNDNISSTYTEWIDSFGWGTSGYNNKYPYMTSTTDTDYVNGNNHIAGTYYDWGVYNAIYNPKTNTTDVPGTWRTLTKDEWVYLLNTRPTLSSIRYAKATVCGSVGVIIVPDNWSNIYYILTNVNTSSATYTSNIISATDWAKMESAGCVFLPAAGSRWYIYIGGVGSSGDYWSTTYYDSNNAYYLGFYWSTLDVSYNHFLHDGLSVRLVKDVQ
ncbi:MAG: T9SS type A sorting domain-containing protein [Bacteroidales bacterium]|nr:T9SS type A sorting domain-containing protein [Bacteroidales bacterium]